MDRYSVIVVSRRDTMTVYNAAENVCNDYSNFTIAHLNKPAHQISRTTSISC